MIFKFFNFSKKNLKNYNNFMKFFKIRSNKFPSISLEMKVVLNPIFFKKFPTFDFLEFLLV